MNDHLFDIADLSEAHPMDDQTARDVRWRMWAIDRAVEVYGGFDDGTGHFYTYEFFDLVDRIYRWVAKLDDTAAVFQEMDDPMAPASMTESVLSALAIDKYRREQAAKEVTDGL